MKLYPPLMVLIGMLVQIGLAYTGPVGSALSLFWQVLGVFFVILGLLPILAINLAFKKASTTIIPDEPPTALLQDGLFARSRNPIYVGMAVILLGTGLMTGHVWPLLIVPVFIVLVQAFWIVREEENLEAAFGQVYRDYKQKVRRWL